MSTLPAMESTAKASNDFAGMAAELRTTGWDRVMLDHAPEIDRANRRITSGEAELTLDAGVFPAGSDTPGAAAVTSAISELDAGAWDAAAERAAQALADPDTVAAALYVMALCDAATERFAAMARIARFLDGAGIRHPGPTALAGYAAFLDGDDAAARKTMARAARKGRRAPEFAQTLKFVQKTLLEQHFGN